MVKAVGSGVMQEVKVYINIVINMVVFLTMVKIRSASLSTLVVFLFPHYGENTLSIVINIVVFLTMVKIPSASLSTLLSSSLW